MDPSLSRRRTLDCFMGLGFAAVGAFVAYDGLVAYFAPQLATVDKSSNPGVTTLFIGGMLGLLGLAIAAVGWSGSRRPIHIGRQVIAETMRSRPFWTGAAVLGWIAVYFFVLWGRIPYAAATSVFLVGLMAAFKAAAWWKILLIAGIATGAVWYLFGVLAMIPLP